MFDLIYYYLFLARILFFQAADNTMINSSVLTVQPSHSLILWCRSSGVPRWHNPNGMMVTTLTSGQVYQTQIDSNTQALNIPSYNYSLGGQYSCLSQIGADLRIHRNITLMTSINYVVNACLYIQITAIIFYCTFITCSI